MSEVDRFVLACSVNMVSEVREMLARRPGIINMRDSWGVTGLHRAMVSNSRDVVELLLAMEYIDIAVTNSDNSNPLHYGCYSNSVESVRLYLAHRHCNIDIVTMQDRHGNTPQMVARDPGYQECVRILGDYLTTSAFKEVAQLRKKELEILRENTILEAYAN